LGHQTSAQQGTRAAPVGAGSGENSRAVEGLVASASPYVFWMMTEQKRWLIVGLGNPGRRYANNRHNVGFQCLDRLAHAHDLRFGRRFTKARLATGQIREHGVILLKPRTFMNESGQPVASAMHFYRVPMERLLVIFDELDLPQGSVRLRPKGGSGGHKGVGSIIAQLGGQDFCRLRVGIGRPPGRMDPADYVLQDFDDDECILMEQVYDRVVQAVECWLMNGIEIAMTTFNRVRGES
jgi:PTH1 family peptidyl-tRNA hydrolase